MVLDALRQHDTSIDDWSTLALVVEWRDVGTGESLLHKAARARRVDIARALLDRGAVVDARANDGRTLLHCAAAADALDVARLLLERGASIDIVDNNKKAALDIAKENGRVSTQQRVKVDLLFLPLFYCGDRDLG